MYCKSLAMLITHQKQVGICFQTMIIITLALWYVSVMDTSFDHVIDATSNILQPRIKRPDGDPQ